MSGSRKRRAVVWLREPGDPFAHAYFPGRKQGEGPSLLAACGLNRRPGAKPDDGPRCRLCKGALARDYR